MSNVWDVVIVGSGNAALTAGIAASEKGAARNQKCQTFGTSSLWAQGTQP